MLLIDIADKTLSPEEAEILSHPLVSGLILFSRNFAERAQIQELIREIRAKVKKPLLITVDQEGGRVQRFREGFTQLPAMQSFLALNHQAEAERLAKEAGWLMAAEMFALDIDLSFAPVLDLGHQSKAIGDRAFGENLADVLPVAEAFIDGMREIGMATTGKHFPGHGYVNADSHLETPRDKRSREQIFQYDLQPFQLLIAKQKLSAIMPAHIIYQTCDSQPASGSVYWLKDVLRKQLGFKGVIFSDDLGMKGADFMGNYVERCEKACRAGCDILLLCNEVQGVIQVLDQWQHQPSLEQQRIHHSLMKKKMLDWQTLTSSSRWQVAHNRLAQLQQDWLEWKAKNTN